MNNEFQKLENIGREMFQKQYGKKMDRLYFSENEYEHFDASGTTNGKAFLTEIKARTKYYTTSFDTAFLEVYKKDKMFEVNKSVSGTCFYTCYYKDAAVTYNLNKIDFDSLPTKLRWLPATTAIESGLKQKLVYELPITAGTINYTYKLI